MGYILQTNTDKTASSVQDKRILSDEWTQEAG